MILFAWSALEVFTVFVATTIVWIAIILAVIKMIKSRARLEFYKKIGYPDENDIKDLPPGRWYVNFGPLPAHFDLCYAGVTNEDTGRYCLIISNKPIPNFFVIVDGPNGKEVKPTDENWK